MFGDPIARLDSMREADRDAFNAAIERVFGAPDYSEAPELRDYFEAVHVASAAEQLVSCDFLREAAPEAVDATAVIQQLYPDAPICRARAPAWFVHTPSKHASEAAALV